MKPESMVNLWTADCIIASELKPEPWTSRQGKDGFVVIFTVKVCDMVHAPVRCVAYNDYAMKLAAKLKYGDKVCIWAHASRFREEFAMLVNRAVLMEYGDAVNE